MKSPGLKQAEMAAYQSQVEFERSVDELTKRVGAVSDKLDHIFSVVDHPLKAIENYAEEAGQIAETRIHKLILDASNEAQTSADELIQSIKLSTQQAIKEFDSRPIIYMGILFSTGLLLGAVIGRLFQDETLPLSREMGSKSIA